MNNMITLMSFTDVFHKYFELKRNGFLMMNGIDNLPLHIALYVLFAVIAYLCGSINFAILISKRKYNDDIRNYGSKNAGFTNMRRVFGKKAGHTVFAGDLLKTVIPVLIATLVSGERGGYIAGLFCIIGHCFPAYYKFKGGKGVAALAAMIFTLEPLLFILLFAAFALIVALTKYISVGSMITALFYPLALNRIYSFMYHTFPSEVAAIVSVMIPFLIIFMHRSNIKRIWAGEEAHFSLHQKALRNDDGSMSEETDTRNAKK